MVRDLEDEKDEKAHKNVNPAVEQDPMNQRELLTLGGTTHIEDSSYHLNVPCTFKLLVGRNWKHHSSHLIVLTQHTFH